jgi:hypothetical protein
VFSFVEVVVELFVVFLNSEVVLSSVAVVFPAFNLVVGFSEVFKLDKMSKVGTVTRFAAIGDGKISAKSDDPISGDNLFVTLLTVCAIKVFAVGVRPVVAVAGLTVAFGGKGKACFSSACLSCHCFLRSALLNFLRSASDVEEFKIVEGFKVAKVTEGEIVALIRGGTVGSVFWL